METLMPEISRYAVVEKGAELADNVRVEPFAYVGPEVTIGLGCVIENGASVLGRTSLGANCHVFPMAIIGSAEDPDRSGQCVIGEANDIREHVTIAGGFDRPTRIGNDNLIMIGCRIGPGAAVGDHCILTNCTQIDADAVIEDYVGTSAFTFVAAGATVGAYTYIAGYTGIEGAAPPYAMVQGYPFRVRGVNSEKLRRCGFGDDDIRALKETFRELYNGTGAKADPKALNRLSARSGLNAHVRGLVETLLASNDGE
jgi:UDP-N-acetylglucosamine acyltransferase